MSQRNEPRNKELVKLRLRNPKKWTLAALSAKYGITEVTVSKIFNRDKELYS